MTTTALLSARTRCINTFSRITFVALTLCAGLLAVAPAAEAVCNAAGCTGRVQRYYVDTLGIYVDIDGDETQISPCTATAGRYIRMLRTFPGYQEAAALLLTAHAQEMPVSIQVVSQTGECVVSYITSDRP